MNENKMTEHEIKIHRELLERIGKVCFEALVKNLDTPEGQAAFVADLRHICHTAGVIKNQIWER